MTTASIVVHKSPPKQLATALKCLQNSSVEKVYVIDNSPTDQLKSISESFPKVVYSKVSNKGFGAGHNIALRAAISDGSDYHLVMNADVVWEGDIISNIIDFMDEHPEVGLLSPKTYYPDGTLQYTCRMLPTPVDMFLNALIPERFNRKRLSDYQLREYNHDKILNCPYLLGSFMFFRVAALKDMGLFDERFFMYPEDIDITRRIHEKWQTLYWPEVSIIHEHQRASKRNLKMFMIHFTNMVKYFNKWGWISDKKRREFNRRLRKSIEKQI